MKKRLVSLLLITMMSLSVVACGTKKDSTKDTSSDSTNIETLEEANDSDETTEVEKTSLSDIERVFSSFENLGSESSFELPKYKNIDITIEKVEVTDDMVEDEINYALTNYTSYDTDFESEVTSSSQINIDFVGTVDGETLDGMSSNKQGVTFTMGQGTFIEGFEESLIGHKPGETVSVDVTFPEDYGVEELNGKDANFEITINYVCGDSIENTYDNAFVQKVSNCTTTEEYEQYIRENLEQYYEEDFKENKDEYAKKQIVRYLIDNTKVNSIDKDVVYNNYSSTLDYYKEYANYYGYTFNAFCETFFSQSEDEFCNQLASEAIEFVTYTSILDEIAKIENITITEDEYQEHLDALAKDNKYESKDALIEEIEANDDSEKTRNDALREKTLKFILENANVKEK